MISNAKNDEELIIISKEFRISKAVAIACEEAKDGAAKPITMKMVK